MQIIPVLPFALTSKVGIAPEEAQHWNSILLACFFATFLVGAPLCGWLADHKGSRRLWFLLGIICLLVSTILLCIGSNLSLLVIGRLLGGISSATYWSGGLGLLVDTVGQENVGKSMGYIALALNLAYLLGPLLGGILFDRCGYESVFVMMFLIILIDLLLRLTLIEKKVSARWERPKSMRESPETPVNKYWNSVYDTKGTPSLSASTELASLTRMSWIYSAKPSRNSFIRPPPPFQPLSDSSKRLPDAQGYEVVNEPTPSRSRLPSMIRLLGSWRLLVALWTNVVNGAILCGFDAVLPLFVNHTFHWGSIGAGLIFIAVTLPSFTAPIVGVITDKHGARWLTACGFGIACPSLVLLRFVSQDTIAHIVILCVLLMILGCSMVLVLTPVMAEMTYIVDLKEKSEPGFFGQGGAYAQIYGVYFCFFSIGALIGPIWAGYLEQSAGWATMTLSFGMLSAITVLPVVFFTGGSLRTSIRQRKSKAGKEGAKLYEHYGSERSWPKMYLDNEQALSRDGLGSVSSWRQI
ncbi:MAG: hypothetical protein Q9160_002716 [Pyrenula sp. 1 TL-2023]